MQDFRYATASLAAFTGRPLTTLRAGFALKTVGSLVNGVMPLRSLVAGFLTTTMRTSPGTMKMPFSGGQHPARQDLEPRRMLLEGIRLQAGRPAHGARCVPRSDVRRAG